MFQLNSADTLFRLEHRHNDGSWSALEPWTGAHDPADLDPERAWANGRIYKCAACEEEIRVTEATDEPGTRRP